MNYDELYVERVERKDGTGGYVMYLMSGRCFYAFVPDTALEWNPEIPPVRRLKDYLRENPIE
ncbi:hypothetical protein HZB88_01675 [archaeon]|nr:hypothetical protein [archaeon]